MRTDIQIDRHTHRGMGRISYNGALCIGNLNRMGRVDGAKSVGLHFFTKIIFVTQRFGLSPSSECTVHIRYRVYISVCGLSPSTPGHGTTIAHSGHHPLPLETLKTSFSTPEHLTRHCRCHIPLHQHSPRGGDRGM